MEALSDKSFVDQCVATFRECVISTLNIGRRDQTPKSVRVVRAMRSARLFCVRPESFVVARFQADLQSSKLANFSGKLEDVQDIEIVRRTREEITELGTFFPFPEPLPFPSTFICYGQFNLDAHQQTQWAQFGILSHPFQSDGVYLLGHLLFRDAVSSIILAFTFFPRTDSRDAEILAGVVYDSEEWFAPLTLDPWTLPILVSHLNTPGAVGKPLAESLGNRLDRKLANRTYRTDIPLPSPFYAVPLRAEIASRPRELMSESPPNIPTVQWSHRWDVRGHEVVRTVRGDLPIDLAERSRLLKRGYRIYEEDVRDPVDLEKLQSRGVPPLQPGQWLAVLAYWRESFVKGPEELPYIPGARL